MAGEVNGTAVIIEDGTGDIVGQGEFTMTHNGNPIPISNKSAGDNVTYLAGELAEEQIVLSGTIVYNDDAQYRALRAARRAGTIDSYTITYESDATTDESIVGTFIVSALSDALPHGGAIMTTVTLSSSGSWTWTAAA